MRDGSPCEIADEAQVRQSDGLVLTASRPRFFIVSPGTETHARALRMTALHEAPYPPGFRPRRGLNWFIIGLLYASFYMCRYNFRFATPGLVADYGFTTFQITGMLSAWSIAYGTGQLINGLLTDRIGGKVAMLIGAAGTIVINLIFGFASFAGTF